ncbi:MAG: hypothetical protein EOP07_08285 [Proteobacteria bacterium]|nr:MAG: hypothetical protein EOP07_08285 [Pseudomonadota bacterium]
MSIRAQDPFVDSFATMREDVNAFLPLLKDETLPLLYGPRLKPCAGAWLSHFTEQMGDKPKDLILEIGSHYGEVILKMAKDEADTAFIGMDITLKRVVKLAQKAQEFSLKNLTSILCNAKFLDQLFAPHELDGVLVFFPDPWAAKKRYHKNRLLKPEFLALLAQKLKPEAYFWFKTDWEPYNAEVLEALKAANWREISPSEGLPSKVYTSRFERLFKAAGQSTFASVWAPPLQTH